jgi:hypothetical protein
VKRYIYEQHQVPLHRINVISYGEDKPIAPNKTRDGRARTAASSSRCSPSSRAPLSTPRSLILPSGLRWRGSRVRVRRRGAADRERNVSRLVGLVR